MAHPKKAPTPRVAVVDSYGSRPSPRGTLAGTDPGFGVFKKAVAVVTLPPPPVVEVAGVSVTLPYPRPRPTAADVLPYGYKDVVPVAARELIERSGTARACVDLLESFIQADGFADEASAALVVNPDGQTADALLGEIAAYTAPLGKTGFALRIKFALDGTPAAYNVPLEWVRKTKDGRFLVDRKLGKIGFALDKAEVLDAFDPASTLEQRIIVALRADQYIPDPQKPGKFLAEQYGQPGQLWFIHQRRPGEEDYPLPVWWPGADDLRTDAEITAFDLEQVQGGFLPMAVLTIIGDLDDTDATRDKSGKTQQGRLREKLEAFTGKGRTRGEVRDFLLVLTSETKEAAPILQSFDATANLKAVDGKRDTISRAVCRHMSCPPVLVGLSTEGKLGASEELSNATKLLQSRVNPMQRAVQRCFETLWPKDENGADFTWTVSTLAIFTYLPNEIWSTLSTDERRAIGGYAALTEGVKTEAEQTAEKLAALSPLVANKVLGSMSRAEIRAMVGLPDDGETAVGADDPATSTASL